MLDWLLDRVTDPSLLDQANQDLHRTLSTWKLAN